MSKGKNAVLYILSNIDDPMIHEFGNKMSQLPEKMQSEFARAIYGHSEFLIRVGNWVLPDDTDTFVRAVHMIRHFREENLALAFAMMDDIPLGFRSQLMGMKEEGVHKYLTLTERAKELLRKEDDFLNDKFWKWALSTEDLEEKLENYCSFDLTRRNIFHIKDYETGYQIAMSLTDEDIENLSGTGGIAASIVAHTCRPKHFRAYIDLWEGWGRKGSLDNILGVEVTDEVLDSYNDLSEDEKDLLLLHDSKEAGVLLKYGKVSGFEEVFGELPDNHIEDLVKNDVDKELIERFVDVYLALGEEERKNLLGEMSTCARFGKDLKKSLFTLAGEYLPESSNYFVMLREAQRFVGIGNASEAAADKTFCDRYVEMPEKDGIRFLTLYTHAGKQVARSDHLESMIDVYLMINSRDDRTEMWAPFYDGLKENLENGTEKEYLDHVKKGLASGAVGGGQYRIVLERVV